MLPECLCMCSPNTWHLHFDRAKTEYEPTKTMYLKEHLTSKVHASTHSCHPHLLHLAPQPERPCRKMQPPPAVAQTITTIAYSLIKYLHMAHNVWGGQSMRFTVQDSAQHISHGDWIDVQIQDSQVSLAKLLASLVLGHELGFPGNYSLLI